MARRGRARSIQRDAADIANDPLALLDTPLLSPELEPVSRLDEFDPLDIPHDRRQFTFGEPEVYRLVTAPSVRQVTRRIDPKISFGDPATVAICVRRKQRREVLFAKRRMRGRGGARRRHWYSNVKC